jgi:hypothetical protein
MLYIWIALGPLNGVSVAEYSSYSLHTLHYWEGTHLGFQHGVLLGGHGMGREAYYDDMRYMRVRLWAADVTCFALHVRNTFLFG